MIHRISLGVRDLARAGAFYDTAIGYGLADGEDMLAEIRACADARRTTNRYKPENTTSRRFHGSLGFVEAGIDEIGEMIAEIRLSP